MQDLLAGEEPLMRESRASERQFEEGLSEKSFQSLGEEDQLNLLYLKLNPVLLEDKQPLNYFIFLNDCRSKDQAAIKSFDNEFEYPKYAALYREQAEKILEIAPSSVTRLVQGVSLGTYNIEKKVFPFAEPVSFTALRLSAGISSTVYCGSSLVYSQSGTAFDHTYTVNFEEVKFSELPMEESAARDFVAQHSGYKRAVNFKLDIDILPEVPKRETDDYGNKGVGFAGQLRRVTAVDVETAVPILVLFERK